MRTTRAIEVPAPARQVWRVLADWERQADWMLDADRVEVVSAEREGVGVRLRVRTRLFGVPVFDEPLEVTGWTPPHVLAIRHGGPVVGAGTWTLAPLPGGTRLTWSEDVVLALPVVGELAARGYAPIMGRLMTRALRRLRAYVIALGPASG